LFFYGLVQLQSALLGEVIVSHEHVRIAGLLGIILAGTFALLRVSRLKIVEPTLAFFLASYSGYLAVDFALKLFKGSTRVSALVYGDTYFYFFVVFALFLLTIQSADAGGLRTTDERGAFRVLYIAALPVFAIGYLQFFLNDPLLNVEDEGGYSVLVYLNTALHHTRAFSLFGSPFTYGHFITLVGALAASWMLHDRHGRASALAGGLLIASGLAAFTTYTRNTYLEFLLSLAGIVIVRTLLKRGWKSPTIMGVAVATSAALYLGLLIFFLTARSLAGGLLYASTFAIRLVAVASVTAKYFLAGGDASTLLFGHGLMQGSKFAELQGIRPLLFDNTYVDVALFSGLVGLVLYLLFFFFLFRYALGRYVITGSYWWLALSGMYFSYPVVAALNIHVGTFFVMTCIVMCYDLLATRRASTATREIFSTGPVMTPA